ncbi:MAG TPA: sigma-70 family RNA polymerase sigma factor [Gemmatimonadales bacterium]|nr:sigma-70 family RNA polymerase sigma factor [Gemmatimonadales bacterium]
MSAGATQGGSGASIDAIRAGSPDALAELYTAYGAALFRLAYRLTGTHEDAEDVVHDVFVGLPEALSHYEERGAFVGWLKRVTARVALMRLRRRGRRREVSLDAAEPATNPASATDAIALQAAVDALPHPLHSVLVLKEIEGYSHAEVGELLGISGAASRVRLNRALRRLRTALENGR